jgi:hypothetical protein
VQPIDGGKRPGMLQQPSLYFHRFTTRWWSKSRIGLNMWLVCSRAYTEKYLKWVIHPSG